VVDNDFWPIFVGCAFAIAIFIAQNQNRIVFAGGSKPFPFIDIVVAFKTAGATDDGVLWVLLEKKSLKYFFYF
jgi:hypothetical protein